MNWRRAGEWMSYGLAVARAEYEREIRNGPPAPISLREQLLADTLREMARRTVGGKIAMEDAREAAEALDRWEKKLPEEHR